jgi:uncharacterized protein YqhQ
LLSFPFCLFLRKEDDFSVGGQAVLEGVMMRSPSYWSLAVRRPDGDIHRNLRPVDSILQRHPRLRLPLLRGVINLGSTLVLGLRALQESAEVALQPADSGDEDAEPEGGKGWGWAEFSVSLALALALFVLLFVLLPTWLAGLLPGARSHVFLFNLAEGLLRVLIFVLYLSAISCLKDVRRMFQYHGAEHQAIHLFEEGLPLRPEEALRQGTDHLRCGTSFLLYALVLTVLVYALLGRPPLWLRVLERVALLPLIAGLAYEIMKLADRYRGSRLLRAMAAPGLALQRLTTRRPAADQAEVAVASLKMVLDAENRPYAS